MLDFKYSIFILKLLMGFQISYVTHTKRSPIHLFFGRKDYCSSDISERRTPGVTLSTLQNQQKKSKSAGVTMMK